MRLAYRRFSSDYPESDWDVHFHHTCANIMNGRCEAEIDDFLYHEGEYFFDRYMSDGKLRLFAHFVGKSPRQVQCAQLVSSAPRLSHRTVARGAQTPEIPSLETETTEAFAGYNNDSANRIDSSPDSQKRPGITSSPVPPKRLGIARYSTLQEVDREPDDEVDDFLIFTAMPADVTKDGMTVDEEIPRSYKRKHPSTSPSAIYAEMHAGATDVQFLDDFDVLMLRGPPEDSRHYRQDYKLCRATSQQAITRTLLIDGDFYGVEAKEACVSCRRRGVACRIYNPAMHLQPWRNGLLRYGKRVITVCAVCRTHGPTSSSVGTCGRSVTNFGVESNV